MSNGPSELAKTDGPVDFEAIIKDTIAAYGNLGVFMGRLFTVDHASIYERYAAELGKDELTDLEKKQALLDAVLSAGLDKMAHSHQINSLVNDTLSCFFVYFSDFQTELQVFIHRSSKKKRTLMNHDDLFSQALQF